GSKGLAESLRFPVIGLQIFLVVGSKQTEAHSQVHRKARSHLPIILHEWFHDLVPVVIPQLGAVLGIALQGIAATGSNTQAIVVEKIGKCVARAIRAPVYVADSQ